MLDNWPNGRINKPYFTRFSPWRLEYNCSTSLRHGICILPVNDLPFVFSLNHFILNKILLNQQPVFYQCMEEFYEYKLKNKPAINYDIYCNTLNRYYNISLCKNVNYKIK